MRVPAKQGKATSQVTGKGTRSSTPHQPNPPPECPPGMRDCLDCQSTAGLVSVDEAIRLPPYSTCPGLGLARSLAACQVPTWVCPAGLLDSTVRQPRVRLLTSTEHAGENKRARKDTTAGSNPPPPSTSLPPKIIKKKAGWERRGSTVHTGKYIQHNNQIALARSLSLSLCFHWCELWLISCVCLQNCFTQLGSFWGRNVI